MSVVFMGMFWFVDLGFFYAAASRFGASESLMLGLKGDSPAPGDVVWLEADTDVRKQILKPPAFEAQPFGS